MCILNGNTCRSPRPFKHTRSTEFEECYLSNCGQSVSMCTTVKLKMCFCDEICAVCTANVLPLLECKAWTVPKRVRKYSSRVSKVHVSAVSSLNSVLQHFHLCYNDVSKMNHAISLKLQTQLWCVIGYYVTATWIFVDLWPSTFHTFLVHLVQIICCNFTSF